MISARLTPPPGKPYLPASLSRSARMAKILHSAPPGVPQPSGGSAKVWTPAGSGSRPVLSRMPIETSAPTEPHTLDRAPPGWLR